MGIEHQSFLEKKWIADKIKKKFHNSKVGLIIKFEINDLDKDSGAPSYNDQLDILEKMEMFEAIKILKKSFKKYLSETSEKSKFNFFTIKILQPGFDEYYQRLERYALKNRITTPMENEPQISIKGLAVYTDDTIRYKGKLIRLSNQQKYLCRLFMENQGRLVDYDTIKDYILKIEKRRTISNKTIAKYVSKLRSSLKVHFRKSVIFSQKEEGWYFNP